MSLTFTNSSPDVDAGENDTAKSKNIINKSFLMRFVTRVSPFIENFLQVPEARPVPGRFPSLLRPAGLVQAPLNVYRSWFLDILSLLLTLIATSIQPGASGRLRLLSIPDRRPSKVRGIS